MSDWTNSIHTGDCFDVLDELPESSVHAVVTDPPYAEGDYNGFMGRDWDSFDGPRAFQEWNRDWATEAKRVLKPGGHLLAFGSDDGHHRTACGIEDAGFEIRTHINWIYAEGFPKALDVSKSIDKQADAEREVVGENPNARSDEAEARTGGKCQSGETVHAAITAPATDAAKEWDGWKTALKPATEFVVMARKPLGEGTVAENVQEWGTGALNIGGCRIESGERPDRRQTTHDTGEREKYGEYESNTSRADGTTTEGRYPSNVVFDAQAAGQLDREVGELETGALTSEQWGPNGESHIYGDESDIQSDGWGGDSGGPSRYFKTISQDSETKKLNSERTLTVCRCQLCNQPLATYAAPSSSTTLQTSQESTAPTSVTSKHGEQDTTSKHTSASSAAKSSRTGQAKSESTAQNSAPEKPAESEKPSSANTAVASSRPYQATNENTAQSPALQRTSTENTSKQTGTTTTSNGNDASSASNTKTTPSSERRSRRAPKQTASTLKASPAKSVALPMRIGTTTTTINLRMCVGCAEVVTSNTTKKSTVDGARDSPKRYKYTSKATKSERTLDGRIANAHPTVKPQDLMEWLVKLATAEGQTVLDPFAGSGTTCAAAKDLGREFVGIERQPKWADVARVRVGLTPEDPARVRSDGAQKGLEAFADGGGSDE